jgi:hypothetical protein
MLVLLAISGPPLMAIEPAGSSFDHLFGRLTDQHQRSVPLALSRSHFASRAQQNGHVQVVAAGVHHAHLLSLRVGGLHRAGVIQAGLFLHRQRIHIRANQQTRPRAILHHRDYAKSLSAVRVFAHMLRHGIAHLAQFACYKRRGLLLVAREFWRAMQMNVSLGQGRHLPLNRCGKIRLCSQRHCNSGHDRQYNSTH